MTQAAKTDAQADGRKGLFADLLKGTSLYSIAMIAQRAMSILLLPVYTRHLSRDDYGVLELLDLVINVTAMLVAVRMGQALFSFYYRAKDDSERAQFVTTALVGATLSGGIQLIIGLPLAVPLSRLVFGKEDYAGLVRLAFLGYAAGGPADLGLAYLQVRNRARDFAVVSIARVICGMTLNLVFLIALGLGPASILLSTFICSTCLAFFTTWIILSNHPAFFRMSALLKMALYSLPLGISGLGEFLLHFGDRAFLSRSVTLSDLGIYGLAYKLGMIVAFVTAPFFTYWNSQMVGIVQRPGGEYAYARMATYLLLGLTFVVLALTMFIDPLMTVLARPNFRAAAMFVPWIALAYLVRGMGTYLSNTFIVVGRPRFVATVTWMGVGACLLGYILLIPQYGLWGAVTSTLTGFAVIAIVSLVKSQRIRPFRYEYGRWVKILACAIMATLPSVILRPAGFWHQIALGAACIGAFAILLAASQFPTEGERRALRDALRRISSQAIS